MTIGGCWKFIDTSAYHPVITWIPCSDDQCCFVGYKTCETEDGTWEFTPTDSGEMLSNCESLPMGCTQFCDKLPPKQKFDLRSVPDTMFGKMLSSKSFSGSRNATVVPNPATGLTVIRLTELATSSEILEVFDSQGRCAVVMTDKVRNGTLVHAVNVRNLPNGSYRWRASNGMDVLAEGGLSVTK